MLGGLSDMLKFGRIFNVKFMICLQAYTSNIVNLTLNVLNPDTLNRNPYRCKP